MHALIGPAISHLREFPADTLTQEIQDKISLHQSLSHEGGNIAFMPVNKELSEETNDYVMIS